MSSFSNLSKLKDEIEDLLKLHHFLLTTLPNRCQKNSNGLSSSSRAVSSCEAVVCDQSSRQDDEDVACTVSVSPIILADIQRASQAIESATCLLSPSLNKTKDTSASETKRKKQQANRVKNTLSSSRTPQVLSGHSATLTSKGNSKQSSAGSLEALTSRPLTRKTRTPHSRYVPAHETAPFLTNPERATVGKRPSSKLSNRRVGPSEIDQPMDKTDKAQNQQKRIQPFRQHAVVQPSNTKALNLQAHVPNLPLEVDENRFKIVIPVKLKALIRKRQKLVRQCCDVIKCRNAQPRRERFIRKLIATLSHEDMCKLLSREFEKLDRMIQEFPVSPEHLDSTNCQNVSSNDCLKTRQILTKLLTQLTLLESAYQKLMLTTCISTNRLNSESVANVLSDLLTATDASNHASTIKSKMLRYHSPNQLSKYCQVKLRYDTLRLESVTMDCFDEQSIFGLHIIQEFPQLLSLSYALVCDKFHRFPSLLRDTIDS